VNKTRARGKFCPAFLLLSLFKSLVFLFDGSAEALNRPQLASAVYFRFFYDERPYFLHGLFSTENNSARHCFFKAFLQEIP
jgi:hypothetical protein